LTTLATVTEANFAGSVRTAITEVLKPVGFRKDGTTFRREFSEVTQIVNVQRSSGNYGGRVKFTVNVGVYVPGYRELESAFSAPGKVREYHCCVRKRLGELRGGRDQWWEIGPDSSEAEIDAVVSDLRDGISQFALPWLATQGTVAGVIESVETTWIPSNWVKFGLLGVLYCLVGDRERCITCLDKATPTDRPRAGPHCAQVRAKCLAHLDGFAQPSAI